MSKYTLNSHTPPSRHNINYRQNEVQATDNQLVENRLFDITSHGNNPIDQVKSSSRSPGQLSVFPSVLDNKETFLQFSPSGAGSKEQKNSFVTCHYRHRNLALAEKLEKSIYAEHSDINKIIRNLRWCNSAAIVEVDQEQSATLHSTSKSCKNPHCSICNRARAAKLSMRLIRAIKDKKNEGVFKNKYFYFLTLTVKHNQETRNGIYLKEFNGYCNKLFRCKLWQKQFGKAGKTYRGGWLHNRECTITPNGYHIHAHALVCGPRLTRPVQEFEKAIREKWLKVTGDSTGVRFDLIKGVTAEDIVKKNEGPSKKLISAIKEVYKYSVKAGPVAKWEDKTAEQYAAWAIATKGKNFINASGIFRGMELTGAKSKYDTKKGVRGFLPEAGYMIGRTSTIQFNHSVKHEFSKRRRTKIVENVYLKRVPGDFEDVTDFADRLLETMRIPYNDEELKYHLPLIVDDERQAATEIEEYHRLETEKWAMEDARRDLLMRQMKLFDSVEKKKKQFFNSSQF